MSNVSQRLPIESLPRIVLRGIGQVMFQENALTGLFFLAGLAVSSPQMAVAALLGSLVGTLVAIGLRYDPRDVQAGIYGFNSTLVAIAVLFYDRPMATTVMLALVGCALAEVVTAVMRRWCSFPTYTAPFIVVTWLILAMARGLGVTADVPPLAAATPDLWSIADGVGQVMFQANAITGVLFVIGIALNRRLEAAWALTGSLVGLLLAGWRQDPQAQIAMGLFGYNAALAAMALWLYRRSLVWPLLAAALSVFITEAFPRTGLETLTAPFVLASWVAIALLHFDQRARAGHST